MRSKFESRAEGENENDFAKMTGTGPEVHFNSKWRNKQNGS